MSEMHFVHRHRFLISKAIYRYIIEAALNYQALNTCEPLNDAFVSTKRLYRLQSYTGDSGLRNAPTRVSEGGVLSLAK